MAPPYAWRLAATDGSCASSASIASSGSVVEVLALPVATQGMALDGVLAALEVDVGELHHASTESAGRASRGLSRARDRPPDRRPTRSRGSRRRRGPSRRTSPAAARWHSGRASGPPPTRRPLRGSRARRSARGCRWRGAGTRSSVTTPKFPPPPRSPQYSSVFSSADARTRSPSAVTSSNDTTLSQDRPCSRASQPIPPPKVSPPTPVCETLPAVVASPCGWVAASSAPSRAPP